MKTTLKLVFLIMFTENVNIITWCTKAVVTRISGLILFTIPLKFTLQFDVSIEVSFCSLVIKQVVPIK